MFQNAIVCPLGITAAGALICHVQISAQAFLMLLRAVLLSVCNEPVLSESAAEGDVSRNAEKLAVEP